MRELGLRTTLPNVSAQRFYEVCVADPTSLQRFHSAVNKDDAASVSDWNVCGASGNRTVKFTMTVDLPHWLISMVGVESIQVVEEQALEWTEPGRRLVISSEPRVVGLALAARTCTRIVLVVEDLQKGEGEGGGGGEQGSGCEVHCTLQVTANVGWPLSTAMEAVMSKDAKASLVTQLDFFGQLLAEAERGEGARQAHYAEVHVRRYSTPAITPASSRHLMVGGAACGTGSGPGSPVVDDAGAGGGGGGMYYDALEILESEFGGHTPLSEVLVDHPGGPGHRESVAAADLHTPLLRGSTSAGDFASLAASTQQHHHRPGSAAAWAMPASGADEAAKAWLAVEGRLAAIERRQAALLCGQAGLLLAAAVACGLLGLLLLRRG